jgi:hypothetical protein
MKLDRSRPYGTITGHPVACYEQDGALFDGAGAPLATPEPQTDPTDRIIETDGVESAKQFLTTILAQNPLSKSVIYKEAEHNNQSWEDVKSAFTLLGGVTFTYNRATMWKLPADGVTA